MATCSELLSSDSDGNWEGQTDSSDRTDDHVRTCFEDSYLKENFSILQEVGRGGYGTVFKVQNNTDKKEYALKLIPLYEGNDEEKLKREVEVLAKISEHENIVGYNTSWIKRCPMQQMEDKSQVKVCLSTNSSLEKWTGKILFIQMEFCEQTLKQFIENEKRNKDEEIDSILREIISGLNHIHSHKVIHRDLKPPNIFLTTFGHVKIGDFGLAKLVDEDVYQERIVPKEETLSKSQTKDLGTLLYQAPEMKTNPPTKQPYDCRVDLFSLGIIVFEMCYPFNTQAERIYVLEDLRKQLTVPTDFESKVGRWANEYRGIIYGLLKLDPEERHSLRKVEDSLPLGNSKDAFFDQSDLKPSSPPENTSQRSIRNSNSEPCELTDLLKYVGIYQLFEKGARSVCFPVGRNCLMSVVSRSRRGKQSQDGRVKFPRFVIKDRPLVFQQKRIQMVWKGEESKHSNPIILQITTRNKKSLPLQAFDIGEICLHESFDFFVFNRSKSTFSKIQPKRLADAVNISSEVAADTVFYFDIPLSNSNIGAPILNLSKTGQICVVGIVTQNVYRKGAKIGAAFISMHGVYSFRIPPVPEETREIAFGKNPFQNPTCTRCSTFGYKVQISSLSEENEALKKEIEQLRMENRLKDLQISQLQETLDDDPFFPRISIISLG